MWVGMAHGARRAHAACSGVCNFARLSDCWISRHCWNAEGVVDTRCSSPLLDVALYPCICVPAHASREHRSTSFTQSARRVSIKQLCSMQVEQIMHPHAWHVWRVTSLSARRVGEIDGILRQRLFTRLVRDSHAIIMLSWETIDALKSKPAMTAMTAMTQPLDATLVTTLRLLVIQLSLLLSFPTPAASTRHGVHRPDRCLPDAPRGRRQVVLVLAVVLAPRQPEPAKEGRARRIPQGGIPDRT